MKRVAALLVCAGCIMAAGAAMPASADEQASVSLSGPGMVLVGQNISLQVSAAQLSEFNAANISIHFNASFLTVVVVQNGSINGTDVPAQATVHDGVLHIINNMHLQPVNGSGSLATVVFTCTATGYSSMTIGGNLSDIQGQEIPVSWNGHQVTATTILLEAQAPDTASAGFDADIAISGVTNFSSINLDVHYNPALLSLDGVENGSIGGTSVTVTSSQEDGVVHLVGVTNASGSGHIATLHFVPRTTGISFINVSNATLSDTDAQEMPALLQNAQVVVETTTPVAPTASFSWYPLTPLRNETVYFSADNSSDPDGDIVNYTWHFGDSTSGTGNVTTHRYAPLGNYMVTLHVTDNDGLYNTTTASLTVANAPPGQPSSPSPIDGAPGISTSTNLSVQVTDSDGDTMDVTFYDASDDSIIDVATGVPSGGTASVTWSGLAYSTTYSWYAMANDSQATNASLTWSFTTQSEPNAPPDAPTNPSPSEGAPGISTSPIMEVGVSDPDGEAMNVTFYDASDDSIIDVATGVPSGGTASVTWSGLAYSTTYSWYAMANDSQATNTSLTWSFTTQSEPNTAPDAPTNPSPSDGATGVSTTPTLEVGVSDPDGEAMNVTFYDASDDSVIGTDGSVSSGGTASVTWSGLAYSTTYSWYAMANDSQATNTSLTWSFTTQQEPPPPPPPEPQPPTAAFSYSADGRTVSFTDQSSDSDGSIMFWQWQFGDGDTGTQANPSHTYAADGTYTVTLTVTDDDSSTDATSTAIQVAIPEPQEPDLAVTDIVIVPEMPSAGDRAQVTLTIANLGTGNANQTSLDLHLDGEWITSMSLPSIATGKQVNRTQALNATAGSHVLKAVVDPDNTVQEENEGNNEETTPFSVTGGDDGEGEAFPWLIVLVAAAVISAGAGLYILFKRGMLS